MPTEDDPEDHHCLLPADQSFSFSRAADTPTLRLMAQNLQSIYGHSRQVAVSSLLINAEALDIDVVGICDTGLNGRGLGYLATRDGVKDHYVVRGCTEAEPGVASQHFRGQGVALLLKKDLAAHQQRVRRISGRAVLVQLGYRRHQLWLICAYAPPGPTGSGAEATRALKNELMSWILEGQRLGHSIILMGDLNGCLNPSLDRLGSITMAPEGILMTSLHGSGLHDVWREGHPELRAYSHEQNTRSGRSKARLDYILATGDLSESCLGTCIAPDDWDTGSDHYAVLAEFHLLGIIHRLPGAPPTAPRRVFDFKKATEEDIEAFRRASSDLPEALKPLFSPETPQGDFDLDELWRNFHEHTLNAAVATLPWHMVAKKRKPNMLSKHEVILKHLGAILRCKGIPGMENILQRKIERVHQMDPDSRAWVTSRASREDILEFRNIIRELVRAEAAKSASERIRFFQERRMNDLGSNMKRLIDSVLDRSRPDSSIHLVKKADGTVTGDPDEVKRTTATHFMECFRERRAKDPMEDTEWADMYRPREDIDPAIYSGLMEPISQEELASAVSDQPNGASAGPSKLPSEILKMMHGSCTIVLRNLFNLFLGKLQMPKTWHQTVIYPICKDDQDFSGDLGKLRPITLIDTGRKLFSTILTKRLSRILEDHGILSGDNFGAAEGRQAHDAVHILQTVIEDAVHKSRNLEICSLDIKKAFDSVPFPSIRKSLERLKIPEGYIELIMQIATARSVQVITGQGLTAPFRPLAGIEQGEVNAPLLWKIFYDPLLTKLKAMTDDGYKMTIGDVEKPKFTSYLNLSDGHMSQGTEGLQTGMPLETPRTIVVPSVAFVDDLTLIAETFEAMVRLIAIVDAFMMLHDIELNPAKTIHARKSSEVKPTLKVSGSPVGTTLTNGELFRILGVLISTHGKHKDAVEELASISHGLASTVRQKTISDKIVHIIVKTVIWPKLIYRAFGHCLSPKDCSRIEMPWRAIMKNKSGLPRSMCNSLLHCSLGYGTPRLADALDHRDFAEFQVWLNSDSLAGQVTRQHLRFLQDLLDYPTFPPTTPVIEGPKMCSTSKYAHFISRLAVRGFRFKTRDTMYCPNDYLNSFDRYIGEVLPQDVWKTARPSLKKLGLAFLSQLRNWNGKNLLDYEVLAGRRRVPAWYRSIQQALCVSPEVLTLKEEFTGPATTRKRGGYYQVPNLEWCNLVAPPSDSSPDFLVWFTDGSLDSARSQAGCAALSDTEHHLASFNGIPGSLSSTSAELGGIYLALKNTPLDRPVVITTDSQAAIGAAKSPLRNTRAQLKDPNMILHEAIQGILASRTASTTFRWIKGHSGIYENELADSLANEARENAAPPLFPPLHRTLSNQYFLSHGSVELSEYARSVLKRQSDHAHETIFLNSHQGLRLKGASPMSRLIAKEALHSVQPREPALFTSQSNSTQRSFRWKFISGYLPTMERQSKWKPDLYQESTCLRCHSAVETTDHVLSCPEAEEDRLAFPENFLSALRESMPGSAAEVRAVGDYALSLGLDIESFRGVLPEPVLESLMSAPLPVPPRAAATGVLKALYRVSFDIWKKRCDVVQSAERELGITPRLKRQPSRHVNRPPGSAASTNMKLGASTESDCAIWSRTNSVIFPTLTTQLPFVAPPQQLANGS